MSELEETKRRLKAELDWRSENASSTARRLALGVVAAMWGLLTMSSANQLIDSRWQHIVLVLAGVVAIASLFADWLQSIVGYFTVNRDWDRVHAADFDPAMEKPFQLNWSYAGTVPLDPHSQSRTFLRESSA